MYKQFVPQLQSFIRKMKKKMHKLWNHLMFVNILKYYSIITCQRRHQMCHTQLVYVCPREINLPYVMPNGDKPAMSYKCAK